MESKEEVFDQYGSKVSPTFVELALTFLTGLSPKSLGLVLEKASLVIDSASDTFCDTAAAFLERIPRGRMTKRLAEAVMKKANLSAFECVWLRTREGAVEVFLNLRSSNEAHGSQWHCYGGMMYANERTVEETMNRLAKGFGGKFKEIVNTGIWFPVDDARGTLLSHIFLVTPEKQDLEGESGQWFSVNKLPDNMVPHHVDIVREAVGWYLKHK